MKLAIEIAVKQSCIVVNNASTLSSVPLKCVVAQIKHEYKLDSEDIVSLSLAKIDGQVHRQARSTYYKGVLV